MKQTPLHKATKNRHSEVVEELVKRTNLALLDIHGNTAKDLLLTDKTTLEKFVTPSAPQTATRKTEGCEQALGLPDIIKSILPMRFYGTKHLIVFLQYVLEEYELWSRTRMDMMKSVQNIRDINFAPGYINRSETHPIVAVKVLFNYDTTALETMAIESMFKEFSLDYITPHPCLALPLYHKTMDVDPSDLPAWPEMDVTTGRRTGVVLLDIFDGNMESFMRKNVGETHSISSMGFHCPTLYIVMYQLCSAIKALRKHGILHQDLKLDNIFFHGKTTNPHIALGDFGCHLALGAEIESFEKTRLNSLGAGAPSHRPPETFARFIGSTSTTVNLSQAEVWSCGVIALELAIGSNPFVETSHLTNYVTENYTTADILSNCQMLRQTLASSVSQDTTATSSVGVDISNAAAAAKLTVAMVQQHYHDRPTAAEAALLWGILTFGPPLAVLMNIVNQPTHEMELQQLVFRHCMETIHAMNIVHSIFLLDLLESVGLRPPSPNGAVCLESALMFFRK
ncbi:hypothetical protein Pelo_14153 [Pelomyxa schiedti]|nr:hypothetical protein Pelo_14153 [Pelomyxa schiedti]